MGQLGKALILSPFATHPLDAGQRKRAFQTTSLLKEWGFSITFLHFAFETRWYWGHNSEDDSVLKEHWEGDVLHFYANKKVGLPPVNGESHQLDEWWDEALGGYIKNIFSKRPYDLFVVHNIWLSKAFDYAPYHCLKVLEMHDLFSQRGKEFEATGMRPEFFHCSEKDEVYGLKRADLLFAIKQEDAEWCKERELGKTQVITIPYVEKSDSQQPGVDSFNDVTPRHPGKVVFGMIGSDIHFNRHAVHALIKELDAVIRETYAPIEFVLAGSICRSVGECPVFVKKLGFVDQVSDFYSAVDVVMVPMLHGTGVKIKSVEALNYRKPVLFTAHSAEGTCYTGTVYSRLSEMAKAASLIALAGRIPSESISSTSLAIQEAPAVLERSRNYFQEVYRRKRPSFVQILAPSSKTKSDISIEAVAGILLFKSLSSPFRPAALAVHPELMQFIPSVPSQPLPLIQDYAELSIVASHAELLIISSSQANILQHLSIPNKDTIILIDLRNLDRAIFAKRLEDALNNMPKISLCIVTPQQASLLNHDQLLKTVVMPLVNSRAEWDPHVGRVLIDQIDLSMADVPLLASEGFTPSLNDLVSNEGIEHIKQLFADC